MVAGELIGSRTLLRFLLGAGNVIAAALLLFPFVGPGSFTLILKEAPSHVKIVAAILAVLCGNGVFLARSIYGHSAPGWLAHWSLRVVNAFGACFSLIATYASFSIGATRAGGVMGIVAIVFAAHAVLLQKTIGHN